MTAWFYSQFPTADLRHFGRRPAAAEVDVHENGKHPVSGRRGLQFPTPFVRVARTGGLIGPRVLIAAEPVD